MSALPERSSTLWPGLLEKLMAAVRAECRVDIYVPDPDHPVLVCGACPVIDCVRSRAEHGLCTSHGQRWRALLVISPTWLLVTDRLGLRVIPLAAGFAAQVLLGAMSFLVPVVRGGGPTTVRGTQARMDRGGALRAVLINATLLVCALPVPGQVRFLAGLLVLGALAAFLPLLLDAVLYAVRARRAGLRGTADRSPLHQHVPEPSREDSRPA